MSGRDRVVYDLLASAAADEDVALTLLEVGIALLRRARATQAGLNALPPELRQAARQQRHQAFTASTGVQP